ncbi:JAB domain-containing protein [Hydrogenophaga sp.]|uniref:JAB domain-containing protein n=1 Tax=Hydrogenophaga sp. TaxID=1904254 RepID=UPI003522A8B2
MSFRHGLPEHERGVIDAALGILGRYLGEPGALFDNPQAVRDFLRLHLGAEKTEVFAVLYLDSQNRAIAFETPFNGTLTQTSVYPREIARAALGHNAAAVIFAHNHPSGAAFPSRADEALTVTLKAALALLDIRVLDHLIVTGSEAVSMAEMGLL